MAAFKAVDPKGRVGVVQHGHRHLWAGTSWGEKMQGALNGIRVLDLASVIMGPVASQQLGDMGADVIKVESPEGDLTRSIGPRRSEKMGAVFLNINRNKRSVVLDLKQAEAREVLHALVRSSDVLIHSNRSKAAEKIGITYKTLTQINPRLIYCHVKGFADEGAYGGLTAFDDTIQALSGLAMLQSAVTNGGEPRYVPTSLADKICGLQAAFSVMVALMHRERTGEGQEVILPMLETMVAFNTTEHLWGHAFEPPLARMGYESVRAGTRRPYKTKDGYLAFLPYSDIHWNTFFKAIGKPEIMDDPRFTKFDDRMKNHTIVFGELVKQLQLRTNAEWVELLGDKDIPMAVVNDLEDLRDDPHLNSVNFWQDVDHPTEGKMRVASIPVSFSRTPGSIRRLAPRLGEHTYEVLRELDFADDEIMRLHDVGAVRGPMPATA
jgi:formyl-CoA transferase